MRVLFAGSPDIAVPTLRALAREHQVVGVLTNPESAKGRGRTLTSTPVGVAARELLGSDCPVLAPTTLGAAARAEVAALKPEILVAFAYGRIFGPKFLALFPRGGINVHPSLLPHYRGSSPIQQAILDMVPETGVSVQRIALEMDTGDLLCAEKIPLTGRETTGSLSAVAAAKGAELTLAALSAMEEGRDEATPQRGQPSWCQKIGKEDGLVDWHLPCAQIDARIRAFNPWPMAYTFLRGQRLNLLESFPYPDGAGLSALPKVPPGTIIRIDKASGGILVQTGSGVLGLRVVQLSARKALPFVQFANGVRDLPGTLLTSRPE